jgi:hypothetical protein
MPAALSGPCRTVRAALAGASALVLFACGGGGPGDATGRATPLATSVERGTLLQSTWSAYPRLVRLAHQADPARNGRIVASVTELADGVLQAGFHASSDDGASFQRIGTLVDPEFATGLCCGTLFEMPQAVGAIPAGTLLYAASVGADRADVLMAQPVFRSDDAGATFRRIDGATCGRSAVPRVPNGEGSGLWEPEFLVAADGSLACIFSDETEPGRSQVLKLTATRDGVSWSAPAVVVAGPSASDRPGMAVVRKLPSGRYAMSLETCSTARLDCAAHLKLSDDGLDWGALGTLGTRPQTGTGQYFRHAPTLAWTATAAKPRGVLVLVGQIVAADKAGTEVSGNGRVLFVDDSGEGAGAWRAVAAPIGLASPPQAWNYCQNYSTPLLPSVDGTGVLLMQTDLTADGGCAARFGRGALGP